MHKRVAPPPSLLTRPIAHRGLHAPGTRRIENSRAAIDAAIAAGYALEIDVQRAACGTPVVFHDADLDRLTGQTGPVAARTASELATIPLSGSDETIPTLAEILSLISARAPVLVEIKNQDGAGPESAALAEAVAALLSNHSGPLAVMSFNPLQIARVAEAAPTLPRGLTTTDFAGPAWDALPSPVRTALAALAAVAPLGCGFVSHKHDALSHPPLRTLDLPILCWTIRTEEAEARARQTAVNITFEGYLPDIPAGP